MYNGQYAKGVVHLIVFAILVSLADEHGIFGLFIAGWVCYQVIEAHHTAKARRDGTPLPNPFGFNDIGDRMGFTSGPDIAAAARDAAQAAAASFNAAAAGFNRPAPGTPPPPTQAATGWGAPTDQYQAQYPP